VIGGEAEHGSVKFIEYPGLLGRGEPTAVVGASKPLVDPVGFVDHQLPRHIPVNIWVGTIGPPQVHMVRELALRWQRS